MKMRTKVFLATVLMTGVLKWATVFNSDSTNYSVQIGSSSEDIRLRSSINLTGEINLRIDQ